MLHGDETRQEHRENGFNRMAEEAIRVISEGAVMLHQNEMRQKYGEDGFNRMVEEAMQVIGEKNSIEIGKYFDKLYLEVGGNFEEYYFVLDDATYLLERSMSDEEIEAQDQKMQNAKPGIKRPRSAHEMTLAEMFARLDNGTYWDQLNDPLPQETYQHLLLTSDLYEKYGADPYRQIVSGISDTIKAGGPVEIGKQLDKLYLRLGGNFDEYCHTVDEAIRRIIRRPKLSDTYADEIEEQVKKLRAARPGIRRPRSTREMTLEEADEKLQDGTYWHQLDEKESRF